MSYGFAAAGSGGHVYPALAVAEALVRRGVGSDDIVFFGGDRMEATTVPDAGFPFVGVDIHGIRRSLSKDNVLLPRKVLIARSQMADEIERRKIGVVAVFGGYVSGPAAQAARKQRVPYVVHEANAVPGIANRMIARRAAAVLTSYQPAASRLPGASVIGSPLRSSFIHFDADVLAPLARQRYGIGEGPVLGIVGGSLGAAALNAIATDLAHLPDRDFHILHVTGRDHFDAIAEAAASVEGWTVLGYEDDMASLFAASDVVLARGGAMTIAELHATRTPAVIVPLPAGGGYQGRNADDAVAIGGMIVVEQEHREDVVATVRSLMDDDERRSAMTQALTDAPHLTAADTMADVLVGLHDG